MTKTPKPLPCPFCGGKASDVIGVYGPQIGCLECGAHGPDMGEWGWHKNTNKAVMETIKAWNKRRGQG